MTKNKRREILTMARNLSAAGSHDAARAAFALVGISYVVAGVRSECN